VSYLIHLVEDEPNLNQVLSSYLSKEGWQVRSFTDGDAARQAVRDHPHLWILDIMLPGVDGYQLIREIKEDLASMPVIFISARDAELDRVVGLEIGGDDYLPKPFLPRELVIRARNLLMRSYPLPAAAAAAVSPPILVPPYRLEPDSRILRTEHELVELTSKEFDMLQLFFTHLGQAFTREQLLNRIWGGDYFGSDRVVDDLIRRIRKKMPELRLETLYGHGYRLVRP
jgi:two-component system response regulator CssR